MLCAVLSQDVSICLGTSLQIIPAANLPLRTVKAGGSLAIINLQATPKDKKAAVVIHAKVDKVGTELSDVVRYFLAKASRCMVGS